MADIPWSEILKTTGSPQWKTLLKDKALKAQSLSISKRKKAKSEEAGTAAQGTF